MLDVDFDGLELVFEEEEADAAKALGVPLAGGKAIDDLFFGVVAGADFGHEGVEHAGVVDYGFAGQENRVDGAGIVDELGVATVFEAVAAGVCFTLGGTGAGALLGVGRDLNWPGSCTFGWIYRSHRENGRWMGAAGEHNGAKPWRLECRLRANRCNRRATILPPARASADGCTPLSDYSMVASA